MIWITVFIYLMGAYACFALIEEMRASRQDLDRKTTNAFKITILITLIAWPIVTACVFIMVAYDATRSGIK
jgi:heme/copper-type cytochrome/quinol oxidase subunit 2